MKRVVLVLLGLCWMASVFASSKVRIFGYVIDENNRGIESANIVQEHTTNGTSSNRNGYYELWVEMTDTVVVVYSSVGYTTIRQQLFTHNQTLCVNVVLTSTEEMLDEVTITGFRKQNTMMDYLDAQTARIMPDVSGGGIESLLITFAGVSQNNEMSGQYNVRGGNFDENSIYVNGIEIHRPLLIRAGQQEGLSFVNPKMVENIYFSAGGYGAKYGDRSSSVLDITYKRPRGFEASIDASLLGTNAYVGHGNDKITGMYAFRYKTNQYVLKSLQQVGNYDPRFLDAQTQLTFRFSPKWELRLQGYYSQNKYRFFPDSMSNNFGIMSNVKNLTVFYQGHESDVFETGFGAISLLGKINSEVSLDMDFSGYYSTEQENYDIRGEYILQNVMGTNVSVGRDMYAETVFDKQDILGTGIYQEHARNSLKNRVLTAAINSHWKHADNDLHWGANIQFEQLKDQVSEWEWRDSTGYSVPLNSSMELYYCMKSASSMQSVRTQAFLENTSQWETKHGTVKLIGGVRMNWWSWNKEVLVSPRVSVIWLPGWKHDFAFRFATGLYHQAPFYKEVRDTFVDANHITRINLNHTIRASRNVHWVVGGDYYFRMLARPFKLTAELYSKYMDRGISYSVENVQVRYSGENDIEGYTVGLDLKFYGELVPGVDSWITFSAMRSRERFIKDEYHLGWIPSPQEQRYSFSMLFQDYLPQLPQLRAQVKFIVNDGLPYGAPRSMTTRNKGRMPNYKRFDLGLIHICDKNSYAFMKKSKVVKRWSVGLDIFNLIDFKNVNSYFWVSDAYGNQWASPNYLSGRRWNFKISVDF